MMKKVYILLTIIFITTTTISSILSQSCLPEGIEFTTQEQIDNFQTNYPDCSKIHGNISISGDVNNLNGLSLIQVIEGGLIISSTNNLHNLDGLESLDSIGTILNEYGYYGGLSIGNTQLVWCDTNDSLSNIDGLSSLKYVGGSIGIKCSPLLENLNGLDSLTSIGGGLLLTAYIFQWDTYIGTSVLDNIEGLSNLTSINGAIRIVNLDSLTSLQGLQNIDPQGISLIEIYDNLNLSYCEVASVCGHLLNGGAYNIQDNALGCDSEEEVLLACGFVGVSETNTKKSFSIYPNPTKGKINIDLGSLSDASIKVLNASGQLIYHKEHINTPNYQFELEAAPGIYILELSAEGEKQQFKLVKQ